MATPGFAVALMAVAVVPAQRPELLPHAQEVGTVRFATSCGTAAQPTFNHAVALLHSFAFAAASDGFHTVLRAEPRCAMAWWGLAVAAWGNPFAAGIKPAGQIQRGLDAVNRARLAGAPTARETLYIDAAARLYEHADSLDQRTRLLAYRDGMARLVRTEPADTEATIFYALALVTSADPADKTYASQLVAGATLENLFAVLPNHPGLAHYIIHSYDVPALANRALGAAQRYSRIAPENSHALHMPSHTYTRVGQWQQSIDANLASARAARREGGTAEELHASDYLVYAYLQLGQDRAAAKILAALPGIARNLDPAAVGAAAPPSAGYFAIAAIPARVALERGAWSEAAQLDLRPSPVPFADAMTWFARALGAAHTRDTLAAQAAITALSTIGVRLSQAGETYWSQQVEIQRRGAAAWLAFTSGRRDEGLGEMRAAADQEDATEKNAITPGPLAPARELLGEMLLNAGKPAEALTAFEAVLEHEPNRFRALAGAGKSARAAGDIAAAVRYEAPLRRLGARSDRP